MYNVALDQWIDRTIAVTVASEKKTTARIFGQLELEQPYVNGMRDKENAYATAMGGLGFGRQLDKDRSLNGSAYLDYGQLDASGIRDLQYKIEYLGNQNDVVRDVRIEDKLKYRYIEEGLDRQLLVQGAHVGLASAGAEPKVKLAVDAGLPARPARARFPHRPLAGDLPALAEVHPARAPSASTSTASCSTTAPTTPSSIRPGRSPS